MMSTILLSISEPNDILNLDPTYPSKQDPVLLGIAVANLDEAVSD